MDTSYTSLLNMLIISFQIVNILKHVLIMCLGANFETRMILFDWSLFIGGIDIYTSIALTLGITWGLILRLLLTYTPNERHIYWTKLFEIINQRMNMDEMYFNNKHLDMLYKLIVRFRQLVKLKHIMFLIYCKFQVLV